MTPQNLLSSATWHGKRVGRAEAASDKITADYERSWFRRLLGLCSHSEQDDLELAYRKAKQSVTGTWSACL